MQRAADASRSHMESIVALKVAPYLRDPGGKLPFPGVYALAVNHPDVELLLLASRGRSVANV